MCFRPAISSKPKTCPSCGQVNPPSSVQCAICGAELPEELVPCPKCGALNDSGALECAECGVEFGLAEDDDDIIAPTAPSAPAPNAPSAPGAPNA